MPGTLQKHLSTAIPKAAADLETALLRLPAEKRGWSAMDKARTALDQVAECAILNGSTAEMLVSRSFGNFDMAGFQAQKDALAADETALLKLLKDNSAKVAAVIAELPDSELEATIEMPWGALTLAQIAAYPFWNCCYHEGQINFIASMLGCLD